MQTTVQRALPRRICRQTMHRSMTILLCTLSLTGCALRDLRPVEAVNVDANTRGRALVELCARTHGEHVWRRTRTVRLVYEDTWPNAVLRTLYSPLRDRVTTVETTFEAGSGFVSETVYLDGHRGGEGVAAKGDQVFALRDQQRRERTGRRYQIYVPGTQYLWELPLRMSSDVQHLQWVGVRQHDARPVDVVSATWGSTQPRDDSDQYLLYIDRSTHLLVRADHTVRARGKRYANSVEFSDHADFQGIILPRQLTVRQTHPVRARLRTARLQSAQINRGTR